MNISTIDVCGKICSISADESAEYVIIQPMGSHENEMFHEEAEWILQNTDKRIGFILFPIADWNRELSPWKAKQAFGEEYFGDGAGETLNIITECLIPALQRKINIPDDAKYILGGYSLAGLFSLWSAYQTDVFHAVAACSPSVWMSGWQEYAESHRPLTQHVYLSLGTKEHKTRNPVLQTVKQAVVLQYEQLQSQKVHTALEWNHGNHFQDNSSRMSKAFLWTIKVNEESCVTNRDNQSGSGSYL